MPAAKEDAPQFDYDEAKLRPRGANILDDVAACLTEGKLKDTQITVIGRTDPRGTDEHNQALGASRATAVRSYLMTRGVPAERINLVSRGEKGASGDDEKTWALDRRVDVELGSVSSQGAAFNEPAATKGGPLVSATAKTVKREPDKRGKAGTYADSVESGADGASKSEAVPPPSVPTPAK